MTRLAPFFVILSAWTLQAATAPARAQEGDTPDGVDPGLTTLLRAPERADTQHQADQVGGDFDALPASLTGVIRIRLGMTPQAAMQSCVDQGGTPSVENARAGRFRIECSGDVVVSRLALRVSATGQDGRVTHVSVNAQGQSLDAWKQWIERLLGRSAIEDASRLPSSWSGVWKPADLQITATWIDLRAAGRSTGASLFITRAAPSEHDGAGDGSSGGANAPAEEVDRRHVLHFDLEGSISDFRAACVAQQGDEIETTGRARRLAGCLGRPWVGMNNRNEVYATPGPRGRIERIVFVHGRDIEGVLSVLSRTFGRAHQVIRMRDTSAFNWFNVSSGGAEWNIEATTAGTVVFERQSRRRERGQRAR